MCTYSYSESVQLAAQARCRINSDSKREIVTVIAESAQEESAAQDCRMHDSGGKQQERLGKV